MPIFDEREHAFEAKFAHDQEIAFEIKVRRNRLVCLWAAGKMGLLGQAAEHYALDVVGEEVRHSDDALVARLLGDLRAHGINMAEQQVRTELSRDARRARQEIAGKSTSQP